MMEISSGSDDRGQPGVTLLVVRPHPDDESSATGGLLAYYHERGVQTGVVICTGGEEGEIHDPTLDPVADRPRLRVIRERSCVRRVRCLGLRSCGCWATGIRGCRGRPLISTGTPLCRPTWGRRWVGWCASSGDCGPA